MINKTTPEMRDKIRRKTVIVMPDRPSERGIHAAAIKDALSKPICGEENSVLAELDRVVDEANEVLERVEGRVDELKDTTIDVDSTSTTVAYTIKNNESKSFVAPGISSVTITIPSDISIGFTGGMLFKCGNPPPSVSFVNASTKAVKYIQFSMPITEYIPQNDVTCRLLVDCDESDTVTVWIVEA